MASVEGEDYEGELVVKIFAVYEHLMEGHQDTTTWISKQYVQLIKYLKENGKMSHNIVPQCHHLVPCAIQCRKRRHGNVGRGFCGPQSHGPGIRTGDPPRDLSLGITLGEFPLCLGP